MSTQSLAALTLPALTGVAGRVEIRGRPHGDVRTTSCCVALVIAT